MNPAILTAVALVAMFAMTVWLTGVSRRYALRAQLIDAVNARGSHDVATPRGGGIAFAGCYVGVLACCGFTGLVERHIVLALIGVGLPVAAVGWVDDHRHVRPLVRLAVHFASAGWAIALLGVLPLQSIVPVSPISWVISAIVTALFVVWVLNLYNFMDGIDGIAAAEAASVCVSGSVVCWMAGGDLASTVPALLLTAGVLGFLCWNWPPAKIFMGDVGSGFLGVMLAAFTIASGFVSPVLPAAWIVLLGVFVSDATVTLIRRLARQEAVYQAHRSHAYQRLAIKYGSHRVVTIGTILITWFFCLPVSACIVAAAITPWEGLLIAYLPLCAAAFLCGAGAPETSLIETPHRLDADAAKKD